MKTLILARHAQAEPLSTCDAERALTTEGVTQSKILRRAVAQSNIAPEVIYSSEAQRANQTAQIVCDIAQVKHKHMPSLYFKGGLGIVEDIRMLDDSVQAVMVIGHNPAITEVLDILSGSMTTYMNTADAWVLSFDANNWIDVGAKCCLSRDKLKKRTRK